MARIKELHVNGARRRVDADADRSLLSVLRDDLDLTGSKYGCGEGRCGACTVLLDGQPVRSCTTPVGSVGAQPVRTIEGLAKGDKLHPLQEAFLQAGALQCGYCTSGMIMSALALLTILFGAMQGVSRGDREQKTEDALKARFYKEYPAAADRLRSALQMVHGKGRFRNRTWKIQATPWSDLEFFMSGEKTRLEIIKRYPSKRAAANHEAYLTTPTESALVMDPNTPFAFSKYEGGEPSKGIQVNKEIVLGQFVKAAYCLPGEESILHFLEKGSMVMTKINESSEHRGWVDAEFNLTEKRQSSQGATDTLVEAKVSISFSCEEDWCIRKLRLATQKPHRVTLTFYIEDLLHSPTGYIPKTVRRVLSSPQGKGDWDSCHEFELKEMNTDPISDSVFTVEALGAISSKSRALRSWIIAIVAGLVVLSLLAAFRWHVARRRVKIGEKK